MSNSEKQPTTYEELVKSIVRQMVTNGAHPQLALEEFIDRETKLLDSLKRRADEVIELLLRQGAGQAIIDDKKKSFAIYYELLCQRKVAAGILKIAEWSPAEE
jgi:hypothetical protein